ncbi:MAG: histidine phosphatase family protein [Spirochaetales bacterium]|nr:histidine phosphatase family protein [Spirochaetales bacterium]
MEHAGNRPGAEGAARVDARFFAGLARETRFFIARHGQSVGNAKGLIQGLTDYPLDESGREQAAALGAWLRDRGIASCAASPLARARETAEIAAELAGIPPPSFDPVFRELDTGAFSDLSMEQIRARYPAEHAAFERLSWEGVPGAERVAELASRARLAWERLRAEANSSGGNVLCVSHGGFIQWLVRVTFGLEDSWMPLIPTGNCGVFELLAVPLGDGAFVQWHRINHLPTQPKSPALF